MKDRVHTSIRLKQAMDEKGMRQVDLLEALKPYSKKFGVQITKGQLSQYLSGRNEPGHMRLYMLALVLNVSEPWLMGLDVPMERKPLASTDDERVKEFAELFSKLTEEQQTMILHAMKGIAEAK